jgi:hypothetical protein
LIFAGLVRRRGGNCRGGKHQSDCKAFHRSGFPRWPRLSKEKGPAQGRGDSALAIPHAKAQA